MTRQEYISRVQKAYDSGRVSDEVYDCMIRNMEVFYKLSSLYGWAAMPEGELNNELCSVH